MSIGIVTKSIRYSKFTSAAGEVGARNSEMVPGDIKEQPYCNSGTEISFECCWWWPCRTSGMWIHKRERSKMAINKICTYSNLLAAFSITCHVFQQQLGGDATLIFYGTDEGSEGKNAYVQHRPPDFSKFKRLPWQSSFILVFCCTLRVVSARANSVR